MAKSLWLNRIVNYIDRDPEIVRFQTLWRKERLKENDLAVLSGLAGSTVKNMFGGKTRRPAHTTFSKMAGALGYKYDLVREATPDYESEIPKAREEFKLYRTERAKKKQKKPGKRNGHKR
jgi:hypothetical protein